MDKKNLGLVLWAFLIFLKFPLYAVQIEDVEKEILSRISLNHTVYQGKSGYSMKIIDKTESDDVLSQLCDSFLSENYLYVDYMVKELMVTYLRNKDQSIKDPDEVLAQYKLFINKNKEQLDPIISMFASYLKWKGQEVTGIEESPKQKITLSELKAIAVRNILPLKFNEEGRLMYKVCVAGEGFEDYTARNANLEAFTFDTILNALKNNSLNSLTEKPNQLVKKLKLSNDTDTAIKRAQGVYWAILFTDSDFQKLLMDQYEQKKAYLPFVLVEDNGTKMKTG